VLSSRVSEILQLLYAKSHFFRTPPHIPATILRCSPWSRSVMLGLRTADSPSWQTSKLFSKNF